MKPLTFQRLERVLASHGFRVERSSGSHFVWRNDATGRSAVVPHHKGPLPIGTVLSVFRQAGIRRPPR